MEITVVQKDGTITIEPMTKDLLYKLRAHGQLTTVQLRTHLRQIGCLDETYLQAWLNQLDRKN